MLDRLCYPSHVPLLCLVCISHVPNMITHRVLSQLSMSPNRSLLCLLTDIVNTHLPCACLGQNCVPGAPISCLVALITSMLRLLHVFSSPCGGPQRHSPACVWVQLRVFLAGASVSYGLPLVLPCVRCQSVLFSRTRSLYLPWDHRGRDLSEENGLHGNPGDTNNRQLFPVPLSYLLRDACCPVMLEWDIFPPRALLRAGSIAVVYYETLGSFLQAHSELNLTMALISALLLPKKRTVGSSHFMDTSLSTASQVQESGTQQCWEKTMFDLKSKDLDSGCGSAPNML